MTYTTHIFTTCIAVFAMMGIFCTPDSVLAKDPKPTIRDSAYSARFVSQSHSDPIIIEAGATKEVAVTDLLIFLL